MLRAVPLALLAVALGVVLVLLLLGGIPRIAGWYLLQYLPPLLGLITLIVMVAFALIGRRVGRLWAMTLGLASEPHIHIHHQRQDPAVYPLNFAEGLPLTFRDHDGPPMPAGGFELEGETVIFTGDVVRHVGE